MIGPTKNRWKTSGSQLGTVQFCTETATRLTVFSRLSEEGWRPERNRSTSLRCWKRLAFGALGLRLVGVVTELDACRGWHEGPAALFRNALVERILGLVFAARRGLDDFLAQLFGQSVGRSVSTEKRSRIVFVRLHEGAQVGRVLGVEMPGGVSTLDRLGLRRRFGCRRRLGFRRRLGLQRRLGLRRWLGRSAA